ncbi:uncharacterized protein CBL_14464 [Carabus blaptoides fortunei]
MESQWLIIGICGATCSGKTTLAQTCLQLLPEIQIISQDDYFLPKDSDKHTLIPELNHFNWEIMSSLNMEKMYDEIRMITKDRIIDVNVSEILKEFSNWDQEQELQIMNDEKPIGKEELHVIKNKLRKYNIKILLIEGFSIFNYQPIDELCHFKFYMCLCYDTCFARRSKRTYDPADVPGYFEKCVWPEHVRSLQEVQRNSKNVVYISEEYTNKGATVFKHIAFFCKTLF